MIISESRYQLSNMSVLKSIGIRLGVRKFNEHINVKSCYMIKQAKT